MLNAKIGCSVPKEKPDELGSDAPWHAEVIRIMMSGTGNVPLRADAVEFWPSESRGSFSSQFSEHASDYIPRAHEGRHMSTQVSVEPLCA